MRLRSLAGWCLVSVLGSQLALVACGSSDSKRKVPGEYMRGGEGGEAGGDTGATGGTGTGNDAGGPSISGDAGTGQGGVGTEPIGGAGGASDAGAGGEGTVVPFHGLYVSPTGDDLDGGAETEPFQTLAHAVSLAMPGDTIVLLDGTFTAPTLTIPAGVNLMAKNATKATVNGAGNPVVLFEIKGDTRIEGVKFGALQTALHFVGEGVTPGTLTVVDTSFASCATTCLDLSAGAAAVVTAEPDFVIGNGGYGFATLTTGSTLAITGGILQNFNQVQYLRATNGEITLTDVQMLDGAGGVLYARGASNVDMDGVTVATLGDGQLLMDISDQVNLRIVDSDISIKPAVNGAICIYMEMNGVGSLYIENSKLHDCGTALKGAIPAELTLLHTEFYNLDFGGSDLGDGNMGGTVLIDDCQFHDVGYTGMRLGSSNLLLDLKIRNSSFIITAASMWDALIMTASNASSIDLGKVDDPGGNTFIGISDLKTALRMNFAAVPTVYAVGNTWTPNVQGANGSGHYVAPAGSGNTFEVSGAVPGGQNYVKAYNPPTLRLAENP